MLVYFTYSICDFLIPIFKCCVQVSETGTALSQASDQAVPSGNASDTGSMTTNPSYYRNLRISQNSFRSTVSDSEIEAGNVSFIGDILIVLLIVLFFSF